MRFLRVSNVAPALVKLLALGLLVGTATTLTGCGGGTFEDIDAEMAAIQKKPRGRIEPLPEFESYQTFSYGATLLRSPFQPPIEVEEVATVKKRFGKQVKPDLNRVKGQLEDFGLDTLSMTGTLAKGQSNDTLFALVKDANANVHIVKVGHYLGRNHGKVMAINANKIELIEIVPDGQGGWVERPRTLVLQESS